jgi:hypothetical protein
MGRQGNLRRVMHKFRNGRYPSCQVHPNANRRPEADLDEAAGAADARDVLDIGSRRAR